MVYMTFEPVQGEVALPLAQPLNGHVPLGHVADLSLNGLDHQRKLFQINWRLTERRDGLFIVHKLNPEQIYDLIEKRIALQLHHLIVENEERKAKDIHVNEALRHGERHLLVFPAVKTARVSEEKRLKDILNLATGHISNSDVRVLALSAEPAVTIEEVVRGKVRENVAEKGRIGRVVSRVVQTVDRNVNYSTAKEHLNEFFESSVDVLTFNLATSIFLPILMGSDPAKPRASIDEVCAELDNWTLYGHCYGSLSVQEMVNCLFLLGYHLGFSSDEMTKAAKHLCTLTTGTPQPRLPLDIGHSASSVIIAPHNDGFVADLLGTVNLPRTEEPHLKLFERDHAQNLIITGTLPKTIIIENDDGTLEHFTDERAHLAKLYRHYRVKDPNPFVRIMNRTLHLMTSRTGPLDFRGMIDELKSMAGN